MYNCVPVFSAIAVAGGSFEKFVVLTAVVHWGIFACEFFGTSASLCSSDVDYGAAQQ